MSPDGILRRGRYRGRRVIDIDDALSGGSRFQPVGSVSNPSHFPFSFLTQPTDEILIDITVENKGQLIEAIVHETTHVYTETAGMMPG